MSATHHKVFIISTFLFVLANLSQAWTNTACISHTSTSSREHTVLKAAPTPSSASALHYQNGHHDQEPSISNMNNTNDILDSEVRLQNALQAARDADRLYGLCTPASTRAWQVVDDIYSSSSVSRRVEENLKKVLGREESLEFV